MTTHPSRRTFLSGAVAAVTAASLPGKALVATIPPAAVPLPAATSPIEFLRYGLRRGRETIYATYELLKDGVVRVSEDRHPPGEITSFWAHGLGGAFELRGGAGGVYFDIPPGHERYEEIRSAMADEERARIEAEQKHIASEFAEAGFPRGEQQAIDAVLARHRKRFHNAARPIVTSAGASAHGGYVSASFDDERGYQWEYDGVKARRRRDVAISICAPLDEETLTALANYLDEHGTEAEKQALVVKPVERHPGDRQRFGAPPKRATVAASILANRAGREITSDVDYMNFDEVVQSLLAATGAAGAISYQRSAEL